MYWYNWYQACCSSHGEGIWETCSKSSVPQLGIFITKVTWRGSFCSSPYLACISGAWDSWSPDAGQKWPLPSDVFFYCWHLNVVEG